jgi:hypothetical protein
MILEMLSGRAWGTVSCCTGAFFYGNGLALDEFGNPILTGGFAGSSGNLENLFIGASGFVVKYTGGRRLTTVDSNTSAPLVMQWQSIPRETLNLAGRFTGTSSFGMSSNLVSTGGK